MAAKLHQLIRFAHVETFMITRYRRSRFRQQLVKVNGDRSQRGVGLLHSLSFLLGLLAMCSSHARDVSTANAPATVAEKADSGVVEKNGARMWMTIGQRRFAISLVDNDAAQAFGGQLPMTLDMDELNGNEKHAPLPRALPTKDATQPGTIHGGDVMLYGSKTLVVFYLTFDSSYSYTPLGRVDDPTGLAQALGQRGVRVLLSWT